MGKDSKVLNEARKIIKEEAEAILSLSKRLDDSFVRAVDLIYNCHGRVIITGMGKSGIIGKKIAATMASTGTPAYFLHPADGIHGDLGMILPEDILIIISKSGDTEEINNLIPSIKLLGIKIIAITGVPNSTLAKHSNIILNIGVDKEACPLGLAPTTSTTVTLVLGDALALALLNKRNFKAEDFAFFHPGGILGKKLLLKVEDIMHKGESIPKVNESNNLKDVLFEMTSKRLGMTTVVNKKGKLSGIITDGDLRRLLEKGEEFFKLTAFESMIKNPKVITKECLAIEALRKMEDFAITSLVVTDKDSIPEGIIHIHDILKAGIQ
ncbi:MAG: KpsF/GutQ family sugar-phosphate isomerase [Candidatus Firestonebacteria bacterium]|nr:KpsF/GutQ family sugar-phosphate isomerase [Candidatus Firestonebacteria bacterium]